MPDETGSAHPPALADDEQQLLQLVWNALDRTGSWPTFEAIDRTLLSRGDDVDLVELIARIPPLFLHGGRPQGGARADPGGQLSLTVAGAAICSGTEQVLQVVVAAARLGADAYRRGDPAQPVEVTFDQVLEELELDLSEAEAKVLGRRSSMLLVWEPWRGSSSIGEGRWTFNVDRDIRLYKGVATFEEYWQARERQLAAQQALIPGEIWAGTPLGVGKADASTPDSSPPPQARTPEAEQTPAGHVINNYFHAPSNVAIGSDHAKQSIKLPAKAEAEKPVERSEHRETEPTSAAETGPGSHPILVFLGATIGLFGVLPAVIQATGAIWAQAAGASLVALMVFLLLLCWFKWNQWPGMRKIGLVIAGILAVGICVVLIVGNSSR